MIEPRKTSFRVQSPTGVASSFPSEFSVFGPIAAYVGRYQKTKKHFSFPTWMPLEFTAEEPQFSQRIQNLCGLTNDSNKTRDLPAEFE